MTEAAQSAPTSRAESSVAIAPATRPAQALADFNEALRLDPQNKFAWANRAELREISGQRRMAIDDYRKALEIDRRFNPALTGLKRLGAKP